MSRLRPLPLAKTTKYGVRQLHSLAVANIADSPFAVPRQVGPPRASSPTPGQQQPAANQTGPHPSTSIAQASSSQASGSTVLVPCPPSNAQFPLHLLQSWPAIQQQPTTHKSQSLYRLVPSAHGVPKPRSRPLPPTDDSLSLATQVGEDAYFIRPDALGVADGVGGWSSKRHSRQQGQPVTQSNSALFSRRLLHYCSLEMEMNPSQDPDPVEILQKGYERSMDLSLRDGLVGTSTALLAVLAKEAKELRIAHVGDCCAYVVRKQKIVFRSEEMQHSFNYPLQLGPLAPTTPREHAQRLSLPVEENDIVILSTDGMTDNLWDEEVLQQVSQYASSTLESTAPQAPSPMLNAFRTAILPLSLSHALCNRAKSIADGKSSPRSPSSSGSRLSTPFGERAHSAGVPFAGIGKPDDITVVVAVISSLGS